MRRTPRNVVCLALLTAALGLVACSDDTGGPCPCTARVVVRVVDESGDPVPGLLMSLVSDNRFLQDYRPGKAATTIGFTVPVPARVRLVVEDIEGEYVKTLIDQELPAGRHQVVWNGTDDEGVRQHSGRYTVRMTAFDPADGTEMLIGTIDGLMCLLDPQRGPVGVTDADGRIALDDPRLFPHLYDREPMIAYNEAGDNRGTLEPTARMIFTLADTVSGRRQGFTEEVASRSAFEFVWRDKASPDAAATPKYPAYGSDLPPPDEVFNLGPIFPNPFN